MDTGRPDPRQGVPAPFGALLREYRLAAGLSQEALAERAGLSVQGLSALENGRRQIPHRQTVTLLAQALGLTSDQAAALEAAVVRVRPPVPVLAPEPAPAGHDQQPAPAGGMALHPPCGC
jgi:transcriptional regulator with XRE-family HTH domain